MILILPRARNYFLELAGSSRVYVSRAILIKCDLQAVIVHYYRYLTRTTEITMLEFSRQLSETDKKIANRLGNA